MSRPRGLKAAPTWKRQCRAMTPLVTAGSWLDWIRASLAMRRPVGPGPDSHMSSVSTTVVSSVSRVCGFKSLQRCSVGGTVYISTYLRSQIDCLGVSWQSVSAYFELLSTSRCKEAPVSDFSRCLFKVLLVKTCKTLFVVWWSRRRGGPGHVLHLPTARSCAL